MRAPLPNLTKRYEPVFTGLAVVKYRFGWLRIYTSRHHLGPTFGSTCGPSPALDFSQNFRQQKNNMPVSNSVMG